MIKNAQNLKESGERLMLQALTMAMIDFDAGDARRIQHFLKVHSFSRLIGIAEQLDAQTLFVLETAALTHDIGIRPAQEKHGASSGALQELEGPPVAREMLCSLGFDAQTIERVCYLVGHHHTYTNIDGLDYRILVEADFLVNLYEDGDDLSAVKAARERVFRTQTGIWLLQKTFGLAG